MELSAASRQFVVVAVTGRLDDQPVNPAASLTCQFAFLTAGSTSPVENDWRTGEWGQLDGLTAYARILIGPTTAVILTPGLWRAFVRINGTVERPVRHVGDLTVTP